MKFRTVVLKILGVGTYFCWGVYFMRNSILLKSFIKSRYFSKWWLHPELITSGPRFGSGYCHVRLNFHPGSKCYSPHYRGSCQSIKLYLGESDVKFYHSSISLPMFQGSRATYGVTQGHPGKLYDEVDRIFLCYWSVKFKQNKNFAKGYLTIVGLPRVRIWLWLVVTNWHDFCLTRIKPDCCHVLRWNML